MASSKNPFGIQTQGSGDTPFMNSLTNLMAVQGAKAETAGTDQMQALANVLKGIITGSGAQQLTAPAQERVLSQYDSARQALAQTSPRGGARASQNASLAYAPIGTTNELYQQQREQGISQLGDLSKSLASMGFADLSNIGNIQLERDRLYSTTGFGAAFKSALGKDLAGMATGGIQGAAKGAASVLV